MTSAKGCLTLHLVRGEVEGIHAVVGELVQEQHPRNAGEAGGRTGLELWSRLVYDHGARVLSQAASRCFSGGSSATGRPSS